MKYWFKKKNQLSGAQENTYVLSNYGSYNHISNSHDDDFIRVSLGGMGYSRMSYQKDSSKLQIY